MIWLKENAAKKNLTAFSTEFLHLFAVGASSNPQS